MQPDLTLGLLALALLAGRDPSSEADCRSDSSMLVSMNMTLEPRFIEFGMAEVRESAITTQKPIWSDIFNRKSNWM